MLSIPLFFIGLIMASDYLMLFGIVLYAFVAFFQLVTLPVEFNASKRAKQMLREQGILTDEELYGADKVLDAAALTYVAGLATSLLYFLRFLIWVMAIFGRRRD
jgi:Zn-dependent membrane protease YugP